MRALGIVGLGLALACPTAALADPMPSGGLEIVTGMISGTGADAKRIGAAWFPWRYYGGQASWQPTTTDHTLGYTLRATALFGTLYGGNAAQIEDTLSTVQMDLTAGLRFRPWATPRRYLTARVGAELLRTNEPIPDSSDTDTMRRAFLGGIASVGVDQYIYNFLLSVDVRYGLIGDGPSQLALLVGFGVTGP